jgi:hypothetical protein
MRNTYRVIYDFEYGNERRTFQNDCRLYGKDAALKTLIEKYGLRAAHAQNLLEIGYTNVRNIYRELNTLQTLIRKVTP